MSASSFVLYNQLIITGFKSQIQPAKSQSLHNPSKLFHKNIGILTMDSDHRNGGQRFSSALSVPYQREGNDGIEVEDDDTCPVDCVREFKTDEEFFNILEKAKKGNSLVVVDFYRTACGSCKYIEQGFAKLCKGSGDHGDPVIFLKHNVMDEYEEQSEVAERLRIKTVPLFHFYKDGILLEAFPTRDKNRILAAIEKYTSTNQ